VDSDTDGLVATIREEDLTESLEAAMEKFPDTYAVLVRRHGM
jgi:methylthioribulose-1-phosphate dehydratase